MTRSSIFPLALSAALIAGVGCKSNEPIEDDKPAEAAAQVDPNASVSNTDDDAPEPPAPAAGGWSGLIPLASLQTLPAPTTVGVEGYPDKNWHAGVFATAAEWDNFAAIATDVKLDTAPDWDTEKVAFLVLDAQTNALHFTAMNHTDGLSAVQIEWEGIEPFYEDATPAVLAVIPNSHTVAFMAEGDTIISHAIAP